MNKLSAIDANFLYSETPSCPQHIASVQIFAMPGGFQPDFFAQLRELFCQRVHLVPHLTRKLQTMPLGVDHPAWVRDNSFDIDNHLLRAQLPAPGTMAQLEAKIAELHSLVFDRSRPLWAFYVIDGLEGGNIAYYFKSHHACLDGMAGQIAYETLFDATPVPRTVTPPPADFFNAPAPSTAELWLSSWANITKASIDQWCNWPGQLETLTRLARRAANPAEGFGAATQTAPRTSLNVSIDARRTWAAGSLPLASVKAIGVKTGSKLNDVFMAVCAGALRRYLERRGELPDTALIAGVPVSLRKPGDTSMSNQVTMMLVSLETTMRDPLLRLLAIRESSTTAKKLVVDLTHASGPDSAQWGMPNAVTALAQLADATGIAGRAPLPMNVVISNVPGPRKTLYSNGATMLTHYPVSIPVHGNGANITLQSYVDRLDFSITAGAVALADAGQLRDDMLAAYEELLARVTETKRAAPVRVQPRNEPASRLQFDAPPRAEAAPVARSFESAMGQHRQVA